MGEEPESLPAITVRGGADGIVARYDDIERLGRLYAVTGGRLVEAAWEDRAEAADGDLVASALLAPTSFVEAETAILDATYGPRGLVVRAAALEAQSFGFVGVVEIYRAADESRRMAFETLSYGLGYVAGVDLPGVVGVGALVYGGLRLSGLSDEELIAFFEDHPEIVETTVNGSGGLLDGMSANPLLAPFADAMGLDGFHPDTGSAANDLGDLLFGDHHGDLNVSSTTGPFAHAAPQDLGDLVGDLGPAATGADGTISIQQVTSADGSVSFVVQLPGTDDFLSETAIRNLGSNFNLIAGDDTAYGDAIGQAMAAAGVPDDAPVMLVGHSQGGMQAAALAGDPDFDYHVTHVVTAGSPVATSGIPEQVCVLSLENTGDLVPLLDGEANPDSAHHTTVYADVHSGSFGAEPGQNHSLSTYAAIAEAADATDDPSIQQVVASMHDNGFLAAADEGSEVATTFYQTQVGEQIRPAEVRDPWAMLANLAS